MTELERQILRLRIAIIRYCYMTGLTAITNEDVDAIVEAIMAHEPQ